MPTVDATKSAASSLALKSSTLSWKWLVVGLAILAILVSCYVRGSRSEAILLPKGKAKFYRGGIFHRDKFELRANGGRWTIFRSDPPRGDDFGGDLIVPFECAYNESRTLRLQEGGRVYVLDKKDFTRYELRVVNGEWSYDAGDHWQSIFDLDDGLH